MATSSLSSTASATISSCAATSSAVIRAPNQGILQHGNPSVWDSTNPITLFIIQAGIIIIFSRLLHYPLMKLRQPRVISEVIGGIILGPSVMGHVPGFTNAIFPVNSIPGLNLVANLGLIFYLFLVGLEADLRFLVSNWRTAASVGAAGMILPFGCGAAISWGLYNEFRQDSGLVPISFGTYMLFIAVAMAITAFPVLCRIITELKLLHTPVGIIVISAGVANDVVGWILLALCVALVNASSGLTALYVLLVAVAYVLFLVYAVRPGLLWLLRKTGAIENGPSQGIVALVLMMVLASAWFTNVIGIHAIFGAFLMGLIIPHDGGFAIKMTEKIEDLVCALFLPLYFALSGLSTNLGLLNNGITWAYVVGVIAIAFTAKITGGSIAARLTGRVWRESLTIGTLMSCKGLVELIVLNIGLNAKILSTRTFTIFVVMALITTFATTPLVTALYPPWYQTKLDAWKRGEIDWEGNRLNDDDNADTDSLPSEKGDKREISKALVHLRLDTMPGVLALISLFARPTCKAPESKVHPTKRESDETEPQFSGQRPFQVHGIRLKELTDRNSSVMAVTELEEYTQHDPILNTFRTFGQVSNLPVCGTVLLTPPDAFASTLVDTVNDVSANLLLLSWSASGSLSENLILPPESTQQRFANGSFSQFMSKTLSQKDLYSKTAIFIDNGFGSHHTKCHAQNHNRRASQGPLQAPQRGSSSFRETARVSMPLQDQGHHIFCPFFGSDDDRAALQLVLQLARDPSVTATVTLFELANEAGAVADHSALNTTPFFTSRDSLPAALAERVLFVTATATSQSAILAEVVTKAKLEVGQTPRNAGDLIVLGRNATSELGSSIASGASGKEKEALDSDAGRALGPAAGAILSEKEALQASLLVLKAAGRGQ